VHSFCLMHHSLRNYFGCTIWYSWVKRLKWKLGSVTLEIVLILMQGRCMVCMEHTLCLEINLDAPDGTPLSRVSVRGFLTDAHNEITFTQIEAPNSMFSSAIHTVVDGCSLEDGKGVERTARGSSCNYRRIRKWARANQEASSARTSPAA